MEEKQIIFYKTNNSHVNISVFFYNETFWLIQKTISELFNIDRSVVSKHIKNIFDTGELSEQSTCAKFAQVQTVLAIVQRLFFYIGAWQNYLNSFQNGNNHF